MRSRRVGPPGEGEGDAEGDAEPPVVGPPGDRLLDGRGVSDWTAAEQAATTS